MSCSLKKKLLRILSAVMTVFMVCGMFSASASAANEDGIDYRIISTYENVDWENDGQYTAGLHNHTIASDGTNDFNEQIYNYYDRGYDLLAITDHNTMSYSWTETNVIPAIKLGGMLSRKIFKMPTMLTEQEFEDIQNGVGRDGNGMLMIPNGVELNTLGITNHVCAWFGDYGNGLQGVYGDYETVFQRVRETENGLCVINHPGEFTGAKKDNSGGVDTYGDGKYADKYADLLLRYGDVCIGIDVNSKGDGRTKNDRYLFDQVLERVISNGSMTYLICSSDAHATSAVDSGWTVMCMKEKTLDSFRESLTTGAFFGGSHSNCNAYELAEIGQAIGQDLGSDWDADLTKPEPSVNSITVDDNADTITIDADNALLVRWISGGKQIATGATIDLDEYSDSITSYVRAEIFGEGGILYTQAFALKYDGQPEKMNISKVYDGSRVLRWLGDTVYNFLEKFIGFRVVEQLLNGDWLSNLANR